uniref:Uncharacterized protein n=1 Tax=Oryza brachyantha TaxID=4533 RepID=J3L1B6_ORYBR
MAGKVEAAAGEQEQDAAQVASDRMRLLRELKAAVHEDLYEDGRCIIDETEAAEAMAYLHGLMAKVDTSGIVVGDWDFNDPKCLQYLRVD